MSFQYDTKIMDLPLIVIGQQQRCGGTLLTRLFDGHRQLYVHPHECYWGRPYKYHFPNIDDSLNAEEAWNALYEPVLRYLAQDQYIRRGQQEYHFPYHFEYHRQQFVNHFDSATSMRESLALYLTTLFQSFKTEIGGEKPKYFVYFTPRQTLYTDEILQTFSRGHVINMLRHPLGFFASLKKHNRFYDKISAKFLWRIFFVYSIYKTQTHRTKFHLLIFEDFLKDPRAYMTALCDKMDLEFTEALLSPTFCGQIWNGDSSFRSLQGIDPSVADHYRGRLHQEEIAYFEDEVEMYQNYRANPDGFDLDKYLKTDAYLKYLDFYKAHKPFNSKGLVTTPDGINAYFDCLGMGSATQNDYVQYALEDAAESLTLKYEMPDFTNLLVNSPSDFVFDKWILGTPERVPHLTLCVLDIYGAKAAITLLNQVRKSAADNVLEAHFLDCCMNDALGERKDYIVFLLSYSRAQGWASLRNALHGKYGDSLRGVRWKMKLLREYFRQMIAVIFAF